MTVSSPAMTRGYSDLRRRQPRQAFRDGRFFTGDLGRLDDEGRLHLAGRKKLLIEVGGYKVDPIEVEDVVAAHPKVGEAWCVGVPGKAAGEEVVKAVVVPSEDCDERELIALLPRAAGQLQGPAAWSSSARRSPRARSARSCASTIGADADEDAADRQLRLVHLQPLPAAGGGERRRAARRPQRRGDLGRAVGAGVRQRRRSRPGPATPSAARTSASAPTRSPTRRCRCSASASATRASAGSTERASSTRPR